MLNLTQKYNAIDKITIDKEKKLDVITLETNIEYVEK